MTGTETKYTRQEITDYVIKTTAEQFNKDKLEITLETKLVEDLGADSLDAVELVMNYEEYFDIEIADEDAKDMKTPRNAIDYIETKVTT